MVISYIKYFNNLTSREELDDKIKKRLPSNYVLNPYSIDYLNFKPLREPYFTNFTKNWIFGIRKVPRDRWINVERIWVPPSFDKYSLKEVTIYLPKHIDEDIIDHILKFWIKLKNLDIKINKFYIIPEGWPTYRKDSIMLPNINSDNFELFLEFVINFIELDRIREDTTLYCGKISKRIQKLEKIYDKNPKIVLDVLNILQLTDSFENLTRDKMLAGALLKTIQNGSCKQF